MNIEIKNWKVSKLLNKKDLINSQPEYQRGEVWSSEKEALLIDSILRGIDIPKIYLRILNNKHHDYEVADGQQRLNALIRFKENEIKLVDKSIKGLKVGVINNKPVGGLTFDELDKELKSLFLNTKITISFINECTEDEVRTLFGRLQEGVSLNPAEKRNAIISDIGKHIESLVMNHKFFTETTISNKRFKHHDYLSNVVALIVYQNSEDLKSKLLEKLYLNKVYKINATTLKRIDNVLDNIYLIDHFGGKRIKNKYSFIDIFWLLYNLYPKKNLNVRKFKEAFEKFENERLKYRTNINDLIKIKTKEAKDLRDYIVAYDRSGSTTENIEIREQVFNTVFSKYIS